MIKHQNTLDLLSAGTQYLHMVAADVCFVA
jgi:hypothetical protein